MNKTTSKTLKLKSFTTKYPKLLVLFITIIIAIIIFDTGKNYKPLNELLISFRYFGTFISGLLYAYGFTSSPATAILLILSKQQNIIIASLIGGFGAVISDIIIFSFIRHSFIDEINELKKEPLIKVITDKIKNILGKKYKYVVPGIAGILIATPLPTEIGITMLASVKNLSTKNFMKIAYLLHSTGILLILIIGNYI